MASFIAFRPTLHPKARFPYNRSRRYCRRCRRKTCFEQKYFLSDASDTVFPYDHRCRSISLKLGRGDLAFKMPADANERLRRLQLQTGVMLVLMAIHRFWEREIFKNRPQFGTFHTLVEALYF